MSKQAYEQLIEDTQQALGLNELPFVAIVREQGENIGYGRMMQIISHIWREKDPVAAFVVGPCYKQVEVYGEYFTLVDQLKQTREELERVKAERDAYYENRAEIESLRTELSQKVANRSGVPASDR